MQTNLITKVTPLVRIIVLLILILCLLMAKSLYLILFITTLAIVLVLVTEKKVKYYVNIMKKILFLLLFLAFICIIMLGKYQLFEIIGIVYKIIIITIFIIVFMANINFKELHEGLYNFFSPVKLSKHSLEKFTFDLTLTIYFIKYLINSLEKISKSQIWYGKKKTSIKNFTLSCVCYAVYELNELQENLEVSFYKLKINKMNLRSKFILIAFLILFVVCTLKEVIL